MIIIVVFHTKKRCFTTGFKHISFEYVPPAYLVSYVLRLLHLTLVFMNIYVLSVLINFHVVII